MQHKVNEAILWRLIPYIFNQTTMMMFSILLTVMFMLMVRRSLW